MYLLHNKDGASHQLQNGRTYVVGRRDCDILLEDKTVSKRHASIMIKNNIVFVTDLKSSNKTTVDDVPLEPSKETIVKVGAVIKFGSQGACFTLKKDELIITMSGLSKIEKEKLLKTMKSLGGSVLANWTPTCTHVVATEMILTVKVLSALINKQPIVTAEYFQARLQHSEGEAVMPRLENFRPRPSNENSLKQKSDVDFNSDRKELFKNKVFVFPDEATKKKIDSVVKLAGGKCVSFESAHVIKSNLLKNEPEYILIITSENTQSENSEFNECVQFLKENHRRCVPLSEIAMAVFTGSCEKECNTRFNKVGHVMSGRKSDLAGSEQEVESQTQVTSGCANVQCSVMCVPSSQSQSSISVEEDDTRESGAQATQNSSENECAQTKDVKKRLAQWTRGGLSQKSTTGKVSQTKINSFFKRPKLQNTPKADSQMPTPNIETIYFDDDDGNEDNTPLTSFKRKSPDIEESCRKKHKNDSDTLMQKTREVIPQTANKLTDGETEQPKTLDTFNKPLFTSTQNSICVDEEKESSPNSARDPEKKRNPFDFNLKKNCAAKKDYAMNPFFKAKVKESSEEAETPKENFIFDMGKFPAPNFPPAKKLHSNESEVNTKRKRSPSLTKSNNTKRSFTGKDNILSSTRLEDESMGSKVTSFVRSSCFENTNLCRWLSKASESVSEKKTEDLDEETRAYVASFRPAVVEVIPASSFIVRKIQSLTLESRDVEKSSSKPNFKKFKKVQPLHPQTYIIPSSKYVSVLCGENGKQTVIRDDNIPQFENIPSNYEDEEEDEEIEEKEKERVVFEFNY